MKKKLFFGALVLTISLGLFGCGKSDKQEPATTEAQVAGGQSADAKPSDFLKDPEVIDKTNQINRLVDQYYYFDVDQASQTDAYYRGIMDGLGDPYSEYYSKEEFEAMNEDSSGEYVGVGAVVRQDADHTVVVVRPIKNSPAQAAGIKAGDIIRQVDDMVVTDQDLNTVVTKIRGKEGEKAHIKVYRESEGKTLDFEIVRRKVENYSVEYRLDGNVGYIEVMEFNEKTLPEFKEAVDDVLAQGAKGIIFDLRDNPGGLVDICTHMCSYILDGGEILVTKDKNDRVVDEYTDEDDHHVDVPMVIIVNGNSASAAEIFSGVMKDTGKAKLVGTTTYGKGIVQSVIPLKDGSAVKITIAKYFTPSGYDLHKKGIEPDYVVELPDDLQSAVDLPIEDDTQYKKAMELIKEEIGE